MEFSAGNWLNLKTALGFLNAGVPPFEGLDPRKSYQARLRFYQSVELLTRVQGVSFLEVSEESIETAFKGARFRVISKSHLILNKTNSCRPIDMSDIEGLQSAPT